MCHTYFWVMVPRRATRSAHTTQVRMMVQETLAALEAQARAQVEAVKNDPEGRYQLRVDFYEKYGFRELHHLKLHGFGNSELAFMRWEIERGVLNPVDHPTQPGSPWWRAVNGEFLYVSALAALLHEAGLSAQGAPPAAALWMAYLQAPSSKSWYRAHNGSILEGYEKHRMLAFQERRGEQQFVNVVLYRVLYAQSMVEGEFFGDLGKLLANPRLPAVDVLVELPDFYPRHYPLTPHDLASITHRGHDLGDRLVDVMDQWFILPQLTSLYEKAAVWNQSSALLGWVYQDRPIYPKIRPSEDPNPPKSGCMGWLARLAERVGRR